MVAPEKKGTSKHQTPKNHPQTNSLQWVFQKETAGIPHTHVAHVYGIFTYIWLIFKGSIRR